MKKNGDLNCNHGKKVAIGLDMEAINMDTAEDLWKDIVST